ncbi:hypothetical protein TRVL_03717 [Trypanosoma vivax]|nr:hypothetical protein TRVL_03717 [Trypanosoma vivax]
MFALLSLCLLCLIPVNIHAGILKYNQEIVSRDQNAGTIPAWAKYNENVFVKGTTSRVSTMTEILSLDPTDFGSPFFSLDTVKWYISPAGFISPTPAPMCSFFCAEESAESFNGSYSFDYGGHGNGVWPMIGLHVADYAPGSSPTKDGVRVLKDTHNNTGRLTVEYRGVPVRNCPENKNSLTAQVEVSSNGTIVLRYKNVPKCVNASVGLVLSRSERSMVNRSAISRGIAAVRFSPIFDGCNSLNVTACIKHHLCMFCNETSKCHSIYAANVSCVVAPKNASGRAEAYYQVNISHGQPIVDMTSLGSPVTVDVSNQSARLDLGFKFPIFAKDQASRKAQIVHLLSSGVISVLSERQDCKPIWNVCSNGNYSFSILPFATAQRWGSGTTVRYVKLGSNKQHNPFCNDSSCHQGIVVEVAKTIVNNTELRSYTFQVYLDSNGTVEFRYGKPVVDSIFKEDLVFFSYPAPLIGLYRYGMADEASISIPPNLIRTGARVRFTLTGKCNDCGMNGVCQADGSCKCNEGFKGANCGECTDNHYGPKCRQCPSCLNGGTCDSGINGTGSCRCKGMFSGLRCNVTCPEPFDCSACNLRGGYCECGVCHCYKDLGWGGKNCDTLDDPCRKHSFDGCPLCSSMVDKNCKFCADNVCFSGDLVGTPNEYTCSRVIPRRYRPLCKQAVQEELTGIDMGYLMFSFLCLCATVLMVALALLARFLTRVRDIFDMHVVAATGGAPDHRPIHREREVVQAAFIQPKALKGKKHVLGVPLKQIPLEKLYENQQGTRLKRKQC